jgi:hypothetical protein
MYLIRAEPAMESNEHGGTPDAVAAMEPRASRKRARPRP